MGTMHHAALGFFELSNYKSVLMNMKQVKKCNSHVLERVFQSDLEGLYGSLSSDRDTVSDILHIPLMPAEYLG